MSENRRRHLEDLSKSDKKDGGIFGLRRIFGKARDYIKGDTAGSQEKKVKPRVEFGSQSEATEAANNYLEKLRAANQSKYNQLRISNYLDGGLFFLTALASSFAAGKLELAGLTPDEMLHYLAIAILLKFFIGGVQAGLVDSNKKDLEAEYEQTDH